ncbi:hypothetical protein [Coxiella burnetii]|nr:hypothetical protein [Coxiella burnetii]
MNILGFLINLISGAVGGNVLGAAWKKKTLGAIGNSVAGAVGGGVGGSLFKALGILSALGLSSTSFGAVSSSAGVSAVTGAILTAIIGVIKNKMQKT